MSSFNYRWVRGTHGRAGKVHSPRPGSPTVTGAVFTMCGLVAWEGPKIELTRSPVTCGTCLKAEVAA